MLETLRLSFHIVRRNWWVYRKDFVANISPTIADPAFMILSLGVGLGAFVANVQGKTYLQYLAPGLAVSTAMFTAFFETSYGFYIRLTFENIFKAMLTVASPAYLAKRGEPATLADLSHHDCIRLRSATTGRVRDWAFAVGGETVTVPVDGRVVLTDLDAICEAAAAGIGLARLGVHHVLPFLDDGRLVRVLPQFPTTVGTIYAYYAHARLTPPKVRAFIEFLTESFARSEWRARVDALA